MRPTRPTWSSKAVRAITSTLLGGAVFGAPIFAISWLIGHATEGMDEIPGAYFQTVATVIPVLMLAIVVRLSDEAKVVFQGSHTEHSPDDLRQAASQHLADIHGLIERGIQEGIHKDELIKAVRVKTEASELLADTYELPSDSQVSKLRRLGRVAFVVMYGLTALIAFTGLGACFVALAAGNGSHAQMNLALWAMLWMLGMLFVVSWDLSSLGTMSNSEAEQRSYPVDAGSSVRSPSQTYPEQPKDSHP